ncbi:MAG: hypothetical protein A3B74_00795 [Candidatus Kerfeldbacteria bacterium RIFCSPHIGHO2_02_FULL_42_14]|uniref:Glycogen synthase n=1 Tax=Candidatus Kerfeldbacteria bacterium RIFCSPHIGHO2_02_FULL_42_14 TaxID=1798540 RepID=A0A1G2AS94_9BACT|nr:MAG: hypothetical protein A3B74_00795 [Candidatus Kerfeldbacteria bacterium RIFCSPHIGHO2_02_FULL_42_14]OGY81894.1 MAG: hypothetical protein A3E60_00875 [Candidatus Kerfeldbacteria bacterium RIFCSPHIGHO2_12_FULL_42_13]OGY83471.1 MAG: hypothetical protein A3I91_02380 [Candidatus Kerfeldbacteria bacterium RIFCSPLOWO2_02_FULL_42_19]OGY87003.1 MAG: hypothetical protein A3G01_01830 [Candidatus Kerfeldbacteria bacterium RIFCSPLOWO2_12_FULL_43_9]
MRTTKRVLNIIHIASEVDPLSKRGGLADVVESLPKALKALGHDVCLFTPLYGSIDRQQFHLQNIKNDIPLKIDATTSVSFHIWKGELPSGITVFFIDNHEYFGRYKTIYLSEEGSIADNARFLFFDLAVLKVIIELNLKPDILHCHDYQSGLVPYFLKYRFRKSKFFKNTATVFTIHNLVFQLGRNWWEVPPELKDDGRLKLPLMTAVDQISAINFMKRAILTADMVNTVSEQYALEVLTPEVGQNLYRLLNSKYDTGRFIGIVNGIDYNEYNPETDPGLFRKFSIDTLQLKQENKIGLQKMFRLPLNPLIPVIGSTSRIAEQKGFDLVMRVVETFAHLPLQLILFGDGGREYISFFKNIARRYPKKIAIQPFESQDETKILAGSDMFLLPSRFEPCGLGQLKSLRYGSIPIVRATGGLIDTVTNYDPRTQKGNGFVFRSYNSKHLLVAVVRAMENFKYAKEWNALVKRGMQLSFSWALPAKKYVKLYRHALHVKNGSDAVDVYSENT